MVLCMVTSCDLALLMGMMEAPKRAKLKWQQIKLTQCGTSLLSLITKASLL